MPRLHSEQARRAQTANARAASMEYAAERAAANPAKLAKADRIVRTAITRGRVDVEEHIRRVVDSAPPMTNEQRSKLAALVLVDRKIDAAVADAPPLPDDLAARLVELIRTTPASVEQEAA